MKREAHNHPKMLDLASRLNITPTHARGVMETLWNWCADFAPQGNVGKWTDGTISKVCDWPGDPTEFVTSLVNAGWLDRCQVHRIVVHDLEQHAPDWWKTKIKRLKLEFITAKQSTQVTEASGRANSSYECSPEHTAERPLSSPLLTSENPTSPGGLTKPESGFDVSIVTEETLRNAARLRLWFDHDKTRRDSMVEDSEAFLLNVQAAAVKAVDAKARKKCDDPIALFKWIVRRRKWEFIRASDEEAARLLRRAAVCLPFDQAAVDLANKWKVAA